MVCKKFDKLDGKEWCHLEGEFKNWVRRNKNGSLNCNGGDVHLCSKNKYKWLESLSEKERKKMNERYL